MRASVIICTFNRSNFLRDAILSLYKQDFPVSEFELIVVDNNSTDDTEKVIGELEKISLCKLKYVFEEKQGQSFAGNAGVEHAEGGIVLFTDDDIIADRTWISSMISVFDQANISAVGGPVLPIWPFQKPEWLIDDLLWPLSISNCPKALKMGEFIYPDCPIGANMAFRCDIFKKFGGFSVELGRIGDNLISCGEVDLFRKIASAGLRVAFAQNAVIYHRILSERLTKDWFKRRFYSEGESIAMMNMRDTEVALSHTIDRLANVMLYGISEDTFKNDCDDFLGIGYLNYVFFSKDTICSFEERRNILKTFYSKIAQMLRQANSECIQKDAELQSKDAELQSKDAELQSKDAELQTVLNSNAWHIGLYISIFFAYFFPKNSVRRIFLFRVYRRIRFLQMHKKSRKIGCNSVWTKKQ